MDNFLAMLFSEKGATVLLTMYMVSKDVFSSGVSCCKKKGFYRC